MSRFSELTSFFAAFQTMAIVAGFLLTQHSLTQEMPLFFLSLAANNMEARGVAHCSV